MTFEVYPCEDPKVFMPVHMIQLRDMGLAQGQNWHLDDLAADCADDGQYDFLLVAHAAARSPARSAPRAPDRVAGASRSSQPRGSSSGGLGWTSTIGTHMCAGAVTTCDDRPGDVLGLHRVEVALDAEALPARDQLVEDRQVPVVGEAGRASDRPARPTSATPTPSSSSASVAANASRPALVAT